MTTKPASRPAHSAAGSADGSQVLRHQVVVVGGGTAGITVAAQLTRGWFNDTDVAIVEPSDKHYYQPAFTLVGGGTYRLDDTVRDESTVIPKRATWIRDAVTEFDPEHNRVLTRDGRTIEYDYLVVAAGIQINWDGIKGLRESLGSHGVCSNYSFETAGYTWECIRNFTGGTAVFTQPAGAIKCGGAPQKICYLAEDHFRRRGVRDQVRVVFASAGKAIFSIPKYRDVLEQVIARKGIETMFRYNLTAISAESHEAIFQHVDTGDEVAGHFDMIHVTPPQGPPDFVARSPLADEHGWVDVDKYTLQHVRFPNVFGLGDCANLPTSKTGAAIRKEAPVVVRNLKSLMAAQPDTTATHRVRLSPDMGSWCWPNSTTTTIRRRPFRSTRRRNAGRCGC